jgi:hypothetical protein
MTEAIKAVIDKDNKRPRKLTGVKSQKIIISKLTKTKYHEPKLTIKMMMQPDSSKSEKSYRRTINIHIVSESIKYTSVARNKKIDVIKSTVSQTINILKNHNHITTEDTLRLEQVVFNDLLDGSFKTTFKIKAQH